ncbi:hypothetical protein LXL04_009540 [Taraxacum kok-saghyz]
MMMATLLIDLLIQMWTMLVEASLQYISGASNSLSPYTSAHFRLILFDLILAPIQIKSYPPPPYFFLFLLSVYLGQREHTYPSPSPISRSFYILFHSLSATTNKPTSGPNSNLNQHSEGYRDAMEKLELPRATAAQIDSTIEYAPQVFEQNISTNFYAAGHFRRSNNFSMHTKLRISLNVFDQVKAKEGHEVDDVAYIEARRPSLTTRDMFSQNHDMDEPLKED